MAFRSFRSSLLGSKPAEIINISFADVNREEKLMIFINIYINVRK